MIEFLDSSALVKRYVREPGSSQIRRICATADVAVARIVYTEVAAALARATREGMLDEPARDVLLDQLGEDLEAFEVVELRRAVVERTRPLAIRHALRGYDAIQLAAALAVADRGRALRFWSADTHLTAAARAEGLRAAVPG